MRWNRKTFAIAGGGLILAGALTVGLMLARSHGGQPIIGNIRLPIHQYGAATPEAVVKGVLEACAANDWQRASDLFIDGETVHDLGPVKDWCRYATMDGKVQSWEFDTSRTQVDAIGMTLVTQMWLDKERTEQSRAVQWWLRKQGNHWVLVGGM